MKGPLKDKFNIMKSITSKKGEIKKLIYKDVGGTSFIRRGERKPTYMKIFEKGLREKFFGEKGIVTSQNAELQRYFLLEKLKKDNELKQQIDLGALTYLILKDKDNLQQKRIDNYKQGHLERSKLFKSENKHSPLHVKKSSNELTQTISNFNFYNHQSYKKTYTKLIIKKINSVPIDTNPLSENSIQLPSRNKSFKKQKKYVKGVISYSGIGTMNQVSKNSNSSISPFHYTDTNNTNNNNINHSNCSNTINYSKHNEIYPQQYNNNNTISITPYQYQNDVPQTDRFTLENQRSVSELHKSRVKTSPEHVTSRSLYNPKKRKLFEESFFKKASLVQNKHSKMDKTLVKIMSKSKQARKTNNKKIPLVLKKDIEIILGTKLRKKKKWDFQEIPTEGKYSFMSNKKAQMLEISDNIMNMRDNTLKEFGNQIQLSYWKKSDGDENNKPLESKYIKEEIARKKMLMRLNCGLELMHKLSYNVLHNKKI